MIVTEGNIKMHTALYRKKRPTTFESIVGQDAITTTLRNQLKSGHISHAYLFCGTRGTGKTSSAKIFARAVNCPQSAGLGDPCNVCEICKDILAERNLNVIEIDAASNNGVDNIRDLREEVKYPPSTGVYKVYIIDEAHMLTTAAFNALLKTLEEPPAHVIFILATTDPGKIPATILSRCQRYDFKRITQRDIVNTLAGYMQSEGIIVEESALMYIASVSDGAMRDALSILDQCLSLYDGEDITLGKVQSLLGAVDNNALFGYSEALINGDMSAALAVIATASKEGRDFSRFVSDVITHFRNVLVAGQTQGENFDDILDCSFEMAKRYQVQASSVPAETLIGYIREFSELQNQLKYLPQERLALEVCSIKLAGNGKADNGKNEVKIVKEVKETRETKEVEAVEAKTKKVKVEEIKEVREVREVRDTKISTNWQDFCKTLNNPLKSMLSLCKANDNSNNNTNDSSNNNTNNTITITCRDQSSLQFIKDQSPLITTELTKYFNLPEEPIIVFITDGSYNDTDSFKESIKNQISIPIEFE